MNKFDGILIRFDIEYKYDFERNLKYAIVKTSIYCDDEGNIPDVMRNATLQISGHNLTACWGERKDNYRYAYSQRIIGETETWFNVTKKANEYVDQTFDQLINVVRNNILSASGTPQDEVVRKSIIYEDVIRELRGDINEH